MSNKKMKSVVDMTSEEVLGELEEKVKEYERSEVDVRRVKDSEDLRTDGDILRETVNVVSSQSGGDGWQRCGKFLGFRSYGEGRHLEITSFGPPTFGQHSMVILEDDLWLLGKVMLELAERRGKSYVFRA